MTRHFLDGNHYLEAGISAHPDGCQVFSVVHFLAGRLTGFCGGRRHLPEHTLTNPVRPDADDVAEFDQTSEYRHR